MSVSTKQIGTEIHCLLGSADRGQVSILTLLNLSATFNTLDNSILLARLHDMFGTSGKAFEWLSSYFLIDYSQSVSMVRSLHKRNFIIGFLRVLSWAQYSLLCIPIHCLTSFLKESAVITSLLTTLNFTDHELHLTFIHWFTTSSSVFILFGVGWLAIDWSSTMIKLKFLWLDLVGGSVCHKAITWELAVMIFLSKAMSKVSGLHWCYPVCGKAYWPH